MSQQNAEAAKHSNVFKSISSVGLLAFLSSPIWSKFIESWLAQNKVFDDPNSLVASFVSGALAMISSEASRYFAVFVSGILIAYACLKFLESRRAVSSDDVTLAENTEAKLRSLESILIAIRRILDESDPADVAAASEEDLFEGQEANLLSLNVTLQKAGYAEIDFQNYNAHERELLARILNRLAPLIRDGHVGEALSLAQTLFKGANDRLDRIDRSRPVRWIIDDDGDIFYPNYNYTIPHGRIHEFTENGDQRV